MRKLILILFVIASIKTLFGAHVTSSTEKPKREMPPEAQLFQEYWRSKSDTSKTIKKKYGCTAYFHSEARKAENEASLKTILSTLQMNILDPNLDIHERKNLWLC